MFKLRHNRYHMIIICVYIPEDGKKEETIEFYNALETLLDKYNKSHDVLLVGDMSARDVQ